jgi:hypothetical protein
MNGLDGITASVQLNVIGSTAMEIILGQRSPPDNGRYTSSAAKLKLLRPVRLNGFGLADGTTGAGCDEPTCPKFNLN